MRQITAAFSATALALLLTLLALPAFFSSVAAPVRPADETVPTARSGPSTSRPSQVLEPALATPTTRTQRELDERSSLSMAPILADDDRPNVLVLMLDDMRDDDLRFMPNVRRLITEQGVRFKNTFSPHPLCCPARASFYSGLYTHNHKVWSHKDPYGFRVFDDRQTLPRWLHDAGYDTAFVGKYLNGYGRQTRLDGSSSLRYIPPGWTDWRASVDNVHAEPEATSLQGGTYRYFDTTLSNNGVLESHQGQYQTNVYSDVTQEVIRRAAGGPRPFFMQTSFAAPHVGTPHEADDPKTLLRSNARAPLWPTPARPSYVRGRFDDALARLPKWLDTENLSDKPIFVRDQPRLTPREKRAVIEAYRQRAEAIAVVDDKVTDIVHTLRETDELDNTYVLVTSDNGYFLGEHHRRLGKTLPYDPSLRIPLVMRGPGIPAGEVRQDPFLMIDFAPTILRAAGVRIRRPLDGISMLAVARHGDRGWRRPILTETGPRALTTSVPDRHNLMERAFGPSKTRFSQGVRTGQYLYVEHATRERELYDMRRDPRQLVNVVRNPRYAAVVRVLAAELERLRDCGGRQCSRPLPRRLQTREPAPAARYVTAN